MGIKYRIDTQSLLDHPAISGVVSDSNFIFVGVQGQDKQGRQKRFCINIYDLNNFNLIATHNTHDGIHRIHKLKDNLYIHLSSGRLAIFSTDDLQEKSRFPLKKGFNSINVDQNYIYAATEDEIKIIKPTNLVHFASISTYVPKRTHYIFPLEKNLVLVSKFGIINVFEPINITVTNKFRKDITKFHSILIRSEFLKLDQLSNLMGIESKIGLLNWLYMLPTELPFIICDDIIKFNRDKIRKNEIADDIETMVVEYVHWNTKENEQKITNIMKKTEYLNIQTFAELLEFGDSNDLLNWVYTLPPEIPILIKGNEIHFQLEKTSSEDVHRLIDILLEKYTQFEQNQEGKE